MTEQIAIDATDDEIDAIIGAFGGDPREAIRALLHDLAVFAIDAEASVSRGYVRGPKPGVKATSRHTAERLCPAHP